ncbi:hypothetical protein [Streptomyces iakyrus]|uniref:hypothetical protein n=1 Tax=Streptomyces iakyrus TaxID=68219 RepID=UPI0036B3486E
MRSLAIITVLIPLAALGVLGLATVVFIHELAEVLVIANAIRAAKVETGGTDWPDRRLSPGGPSVPAQILQRLAGLPERSGTQPLKVNWVMCFGQAALLGVLRSVMAQSGPQGPLITNNKVAQFVARSDGRLRGAAGADLTRPVQAVDELRAAEFGGDRNIPFTHARPPSRWCGLPSRSARCRNGTPPALEPPDRQLLHHAAAGLSGGAGHRNRLVAHALQPTRQARGRATPGSATLLTVRAVR